MNVDFEFSLQKRKTKMMITEDIINKVPCTQLFGFTNEQNEYAQYLHKKLLNIAMKKNNSNEVGFLINTENWETIVLRGTEDGIDMNLFPQAYNVLKEAKKYSLIFLHNHPNNSCFSSKDLKSFCKHDSLYMITAIQNNGNIHVLAKSDIFYPQTVLFEYNKCVNEQKGFINVIKRKNELGLNYKYGRCKK